MNDGPREPAWLRDVPMQERLFGADEFLRTDVDAEAAAELNTRKRVYGDDGDLTKPRPCPMYGCPAPARAYWQLWAHLENAHRVYTRREVDERNEAEARRFVASIRMREVLAEVAEIRRRTHGEERSA